MPRALPLVVLLGCAGPGLLTDGTSVSMGSHSRGVLRGARRLPTSGEGYVVPQTWRLRQSNYGTDELVGAVVRAARQVARAHPGATLGVADLSRRGGGESPEHRSHHTGRDADLHFFSVDDAGKPLPPPSIVMERYGANGVALPSEVPPPVGETVVAGPTRRFDAQRNWMLVRALIEDPVADVQWLFVASSLEERMLAYAQAAGEPPWLITQASEVMHQPLDSAGHNDHLHVRVYCSPDDRAQGCVDRGPSRWYKKLLKYDRPLVASSRTGTGAAAAALRTWWPGASSAWPF